jgi:cytidine deaminase
VTKAQTPLSEIQNRKAALEKVIKNAYSPYSQFSVAAYIETTDGEHFQGVNIENSSYSLTLCAEASAIAQMITRLGKATIHDVVVISDSDRPCPPCGACLQRLIEFGDKDTMVYISYAGAEKIEAHKLSSLIPLQFDDTFLQ